MKIIRVVATIVLILLPFLPVTAFWLGEINNTNFSTYLLTGVLTGLVMVSLMLLIGGRTKSRLSALNLPAWSLFALGVLVLFPLHLGPPRESPALLQFLGIERFRYGMLLLAVLVFCAAAYLMIIYLKAYPTLIGQIMAIVFFATALFNLWDNYDSWSFGNQMKDWMAAGKRPEDFFPSYNFHHVLRAVARILLYIAAGGLCFLLLVQKSIKKWQAWLILLFCAIGISFCMLFIGYGFQYYFPFMVPAIAMAPAYWIGIVLLSRNTILPKP